MSSEQRIQQLSISIPLPFPDNMKRVRLPNVPDYMGGPLTTFIHGVPILRHATTSKISSYMLPNAAIWPNHGHFLSEYLLSSLTDIVRNRFHGQVSADLADIVRNREGYFAFVCQNRVQVDEVAGYEARQ